MKKGIHPRYYPEARVICSCGNTFTVGSTQELIRTDVCSACHPFFTGEQRIVDTAGQVERFMRRLEKKELAAEERTRPEEIEAVAEVKAPKKLDEAEAARAVAEKLRGEKAPQAASARPAKGTAKTTATGKPGRKKAVKQEVAVSESGQAAE